MTTIEEIITKHDLVCKDARDLLIDRGEEYARKDDELKTFKAVGNDTQITPANIALVLLGIKYHRILEQMNKGEIPRDSFRDLINYCVFCELLLEQEQGIYEGSR